MPATVATATVATAIFATATGFTGAVDLRHRGRVVWQCGCAGDLKRLEATSLDLAPISHRCRGTRPLRPETRPWTRHRTTPHPHATAPPHQHAINT
eukprot:4358022-Prymnesium_polylepis.2